MSMPIRPPLSPSVGRIVHYLDADEGCVAAIIVDVRNDGRASLVPFWPSVGAGHPISDVNQDATRRIHGTWHEPERVGP